MTKKERDARKAILQTELAQLDEQERAERERERERLAAVVVKHIDVLLELRPEHDSSSCSDLNLRSRGCARCLLLAIKKLGMGGDEINVYLEVTRAN